MTLRDLTNLCRLLAKQLLVMLKLPLRAAQSVQRQGVGASNDVE
jgi:hypothetical protein